MSEFNPYAPPSALVSDHGQASALDVQMRREAAASEPEVRSAARWFWWIAGLSLVNVALFYADAGISFMVGLGITALSDAIFANVKPIAFCIDAIALGFFFVIGQQAQRGKLWAFYAGSAVYTLDALIMLAAQEWKSLAFHGLALFFIVRGAMSLREDLQGPPRAAAATPGTPTRARAASRWRR